MENGTRGRGHPKVGESNRGPLILDGSCASSRLAGKDRQNARLAYAQDAPPLLQGATVDRSLLRPVAGRPARRAPTSKQPGRGTRPSGSSPATSSASTAEGRDRRVMRLAQQLRISAGGKRPSLARGEPPPDWGPGFQPTHRLLFGSARSPEPHDTWTERQPGTRQDPRIERPATRKTRHPERAHPPCRTATDVRTVCVGLCQTARARLAGGLGVGEACSRASRSAAAGSISGRRLKLSCSPRTRSVCRSSAVCYQ